MPLSTSRPLVVVTASDPTRHTEPELARGKNELYADAVRRHGAEAVVVDAACPVAERDRLFGAMDGLLLTGGPDVDPALYGEPPRGSQEPDRARDQLELAAWREAERRELPVLGVCRGLQAMNVFAGGSLVQHVEGHSGRSFWKGPALTHPLRVEPRSTLGRILLDGAASRSADAPELVVNSYHHQAVSAARLAPGFVASAWADARGGEAPLVEGLEATAGRWMIGVQCHPERLESTPAAFERLWAAFVEASTARQMP